MSRERQPKLDDILNECLDRMSRGAAVEDCLVAYPDQADELRPLLLTAHAVRSGMRASPREEARSAGLRRLREAMERRQARRSWRSPILVGSLRAWSAAAVALVIFFSGFGVVWASSDSLPDDTLYPVKRTVERARMAWPFRSEEGKARLSEEFARRRAQELSLIAERVNPKRAAALSGRLGQDVDRSVALTVRQADRNESRIADLMRKASGRDQSATRQRVRELRQAAEHRLIASKRRLERDLAANLQRMNAALAQAPADKKAQVRLAIEWVTQHYQRAIQRINSRLSTLEKGGVPQPGAGPMSRGRPAAIDARP